MALPSEILVDVFSFIDNFSVASVALACARFLKIVSGNANRLPLVREFFFRCIEPGLVLSEGTPSETDAGYSCGIEFDRSTAESCRNAFHLAASIAGKHAIAGAYFWYIYDLPIPVEEILDVLPSLRFAEKLELDDDLIARGHPKFEEFDSVKFTERFPRQKRLQMGTVKAGVDWAFLSQPTFLKLSDFTALGKPNAEEEALRFCFDFSLLEPGQLKTVTLPCWSIPGALVDKLIEAVGTCPRRLVISLESSHCGSVCNTDSFETKTGRDFMSTTTRHTSRLMNVTVFVENFRGVTITNDVETIAKKSAVVDDPEDVFAVFQNKELWDTLRGML